MQPDFHDSSAETFYETVSILLHSSYLLQSYSVPFSLPFIPVYTSLLMTSEILTTVMKIIVGFEVFTAVTMKNTVFWDVAPSTR
jgi:hypothetical protein